MKRNIGSADKAIRLFFAPILWVLYYSRVVGGFLGIVMLILSIYFLLSALINFCLLYELLGLSSFRKKE
jgi:heme A synthase